MDYAKAIGICLVVYGHVIRGLFSAGIEIPVNVYSILDSMIYSFHMPLFFFLSGLFFYSSLLRRGVNGLILNKVDTILYPYLIWSIFQGGVEVFLSSYTNSHITLSDVLSLWEPRAQFWFLYVLFFLFVVGAIVFYFVSSRYVVFVFISASMLYLYQKEFSGIIFNIKLFHQIANCLVFFVLGMVFTQYNLARIFISKIVFILLLVAFFVLQYIFHFDLNKTYLDTGVFSLFLACLSILFVVSLSILMSKAPNRYLAAIGASSMAIYLMHTLTGSGVRIILHKFFNIDSLSVHLVIGCLAGVLVPLIALKVIDRVKIPYVFSAPISTWINDVVRKALSVLR